MSKRIDELLGLAYKHAHTEGTLDGADDLSRGQIITLTAHVAEYEAQRDAARDALEADITTLVEAAQALAAREMALRSTGFNAPLGYDSIKSTCFSTADSIADLAKALAAFEN